MIEYEGNKLEDFISENLETYRQKETDKDEMTKILTEALKDVEHGDPDNISDEVMDNLLKTLMSKKFSGDSGMGLPMLSGLLSMRLPEHFALIDCGVLEAVYKIKSKDFFPQELKSLVLKKWQSMRYKNKQLKKINRKDYINYLKILKGIKNRIHEGVFGKEFPLGDIERSIYSYNKYVK